MRQAVALLRGEGLPPEEADEQRERLLAGFRWILVDEYQDIDADQYELISAIESRTHAGVTVEYVPVLLGGVFKLTGNVSPVEGYKPIPAKLEYFRQDIRDWVAYLGIPYRRNPHFPVMTLGIMRGAVALLGTDRFADYVETVFRAMWVHEKKEADGQFLREPSPEPSVHATVDCGAAVRRAPQRSMPWAPFRIRRRSVRSPVCDGRCRC